MASRNNDYLRFSAYSIKDLITRKLSDDTRFTDQIYEGSNLAILIDIVSYMYQCLLYNINNAAAESMWSDTQIYENINRLCRFLNYNPKGCIPAACTLVLKNEGYTGTVIPKYAFIETGKVDSKGKKVCYSVGSNDVHITSNDTISVLFRNGKWKLYSTVFAGNDSPYQTLTLDGVRSDSTGSNTMYVPNDMIDVYVIDESGKCDKWNRVDEGLFTDNRVQNGSRLYTQYDKIYAVRLNEDKTYEITFGDNFNGMQPPKSSSIYVFYFDSNGPDGKLELGDITDANIKHSSSAFGLDKDTYKKVFGSTVGENDDADKGFLYLTENGYWKNIEPSTDAISEETVDEIRRNAPEWFKSGNRLVTCNDWEYFIKNNNAFKGTVIDVKCQNNWGYISTFYRWLYNIGVKQYGNGHYYLDKSKIVKMATYSDAADVNNVYLWIKTKSNADIYQQLFDDETFKIKMLTQEPTYLKPLDVYFAICAQDPDEAAYEYFNDKTLSLTFDKNGSNWLEITIDDNSVYSTNDIKSQVANIFREFFDDSKLTLGQAVDYSILTNQILSIKSVNRIRTVYHNAATGNERIISGISFASWTSSFIDVGGDFEVSNASRSLEVFQFPVLYRKNDIVSKIKVIKRSIGTINSVQY